MKDSKLLAFKRFMGPSGNGMTNKQLKALAGWTSFEAGWDAAEQRWVDWVAAFRLLNPTISLDLFQGATERPPQKKAALAKGKA